MIEYYLKALLYDYKKARGEGKDLDQIVKYLVHRYVKRSRQFEFDLNELGGEDVERVSYLLLLMSLQIQRRPKKERDAIKALLEEVEKHQ